MPLGFSNTTNITINNITQIANNTDPTGFFIRVNHDIYGGWLYFILLVVFWAIMFYAAQQRENQVLTNAMYSGAIVSIVSLFLRAIEVSRAPGVIEGLLTDYQMWIFPIITIIIMVVVWFSKRES